MAGKNFSNISKHRVRQIICISAVIIFLAIMVPITLLVILPAILRNSVDKSSFTLNTFVISSPKQESFMYSLSAGISTGSSISATVHFNEPISFNWIDGNGNDNNLGSMVFNEDLTTSSPITVENEIFNISNSDIFGTFLATAINSSSVIVKIKGLVNVRALGGFLKFNNIHFEKQMAVDGLGGLDKSTGGNATVTSVNVTSVNLSALQVGLNVGVDVLNKSPFGIDDPSLEVDMGLLYESNNVGNFTTKDIKLKPQEKSSMSLTGNVNGIQIATRVLGGGGGGLTGLLSGLMGLSVGTTGTGSGGMSGISSVVNRVRASNVEVSWLNRGLAGQAIKL